MSRGWRERRRGAMIVLAAGTAAVALAAVLGAVAMARPLGFIHVRSNLSQTPRLVSAPPDLAVSPGGDWVAVAWTEEYAAGAGYGKGRGHVYLRAAPEMEAGGWGSKIRVFTGTFQSCAFDAAVAVTGTTAHLIYAVFVDDCNDPNQAVVLHRTCSLADGRCYGEETVASVDKTHGEITWVDLALDVEGNPHVVWSQYYALWDRNAIYFRASDGTDWGGSEFVESTYDGRKPAVAWADGYVHVVWEEKTQLGTRIRYRRRAESGPDMGWRTPQRLCTEQSTWLPGDPDVVAGEGRVFVVWDWCAGIEGGDCARYNLVYRRSNDGGDTWGSDQEETREVGTDLLYFVDPLTQYRSTDDLSERDECLVDLQPSIALNRAGAPTVVWHADVSSGDEDPRYAVYYAYALTSTQDAVGWITPTVLSQGGETVGSAAVGVGEPGAADVQHLHVGYVQRQDTSTWDVSYNSNEDDSYEHIYMPLVLRTG